MPEKNAVLVDADGLVINAIVIDTDAEYEVPEGLTLVVDVEAGIGWQRTTKTGKKFTPPAIPPPTEDELLVERATADVTSLSDDEKDALLRHLLGT